MFCRHTASFKILISKFKILEILNFHPWNLFTGMIWIFDHLHVFSVSTFRSNVPW